MMAINSNASKHIRNDCWISYQQVFMPLFRICNYQIPWLNNVLFFKYYSGEYKEKHVVQPGDLIIANTEQGHKYLLIGYPAIVPYVFGGVGIYSHHIYRLRPRPHSYLTPDFLYQLLLRPEIREQVVGFANGTTVNMLKIEGLQKPKFVLPPRYLVSKFFELAASIRLRHEENIKQSATLAAIRDALLPKLMKGEVDV